MLNGSLADLQGYLKPELEVGAPEVVHVTDRNREYEAVNVKIIASNTAPESADWPKGVFLGVGLSIANLKGASVRCPEIKVDRPSAPISQGHRELPNIYARTFGEAFLEITSDEKRFGDVLFPGQSITYEVKIPSQDIPDTEYHVEGTVSRRHLVHYEHKLTPPDSYTRPQLLSTLRTFNEIDLHNVLDSTINSMPEFGTDTRLSDLEEFGRIISNLVPEISLTQATVNDV